MSSEEFYAIATQLKSPQEHASALQRVAGFDDREVNCLTIELQSRMGSIGKRCLMLGFSCALIGLIFVYLVGQQIISRWTFSVLVCFIVLAPLVAYSIAFSKTTRPVKELREVCLVVTNPQILSFVLKQIKDEDPIFFSGIDKQDMLSLLWTQVGFLLLDDRASFGTVTAGERKLLVTYTSALSKMSNPSQWQLDLLAAIRQSGPRWMTRQESDRYPQSFWR